MQHLSNWQRSFRGSFKEVEALIACDVFKLLHIAEGDDFLGNFG